jgi:hypothetical protein
MAGQQLTLEQQFRLRVFEEQVQQMSTQQAKTFLLKMQEAMMIRENGYLEILRSTWNIDTDRN